MFGKLTIDGVDAYATYGLVIPKGGFNGLAQMPPLKKVDFNDWSFQDGIEPDLTDTKLDTSTFSITFFTFSEAKLNSFFAKMTDGAIHTFVFTEIGLTKRIRYVSCTSRKSIGEMAQVAYTFSDDYPLEGYTYLAPLSTVGGATGYQLDGVDLGAYGISVLKGAKDAILKKSDAKKNLTVSVRNLDGAAYDGYAVKMKERDASIPLLMKARSFTELWRNYKALLFNLSKAGERTLTAYGVDYPCFYKSMSVSYFSPSGEIWLGFNLNICIIR
jgi:hypothetical protein